MNAKFFPTALVCFAASVALSGTASATMIPCGTDTNLNYMHIDDSEVMACLDSGEGNLKGEAGDLFLSGAGLGYSPAGKFEAEDPLENPNPFDIAYTDTGDETGTWSFDSSFWNTYESGAIGFKFGTGNTADEWFVYSLQAGVNSGSWAFFHGLSNENNSGGGLSHVNLYGMDRVVVPEPGTLALLGLGLIGLVASRRKLRMS